MTVTPNTPPEQFTCEACHRSFTDLNVADLSRVRFRMLLCPADFRAAKGDLKVVQDRVDRKKENAKRAEQAGISQAQVKASADEVARRAEQERLDMEVHQRQAFEAEKRRIKTTGRFFDV